MNRTKRLRACLISAALVLSAHAATASPLIVGNSEDFGTGPIETWDYSTDTQVAGFHPDGAMLSTASGRGIAIEGDEIFYTQLVDGFGLTDVIRVAPFNGGFGGADIRTLPNPNPEYGIQALDFLDGSLFALTGLPSGPLVVFELNPTTGAVLDSVGITGPNGNAGGFVVLPTGNFLINDEDSSPTYREYDASTGLATGFSITVPGQAFCRGVDRGSDDSLYFVCGFNSFVKTDMSGNLLGSSSPEESPAEVRDISVVNVPASCGNGSLEESSETCDDGNTLSGDGCSVACHAESCGDLVINDVDESCDDGNTAAGDGCSAICEDEYCGDGLVNDVVESCDDGNAVLGDGCNDGCQTEFCGDRFVNNVDETCDDGNAVSGDGCSSSCFLELSNCGNNVIEEDESCDDGNNVDQDGCTGYCQIEYCGAGVPDDPRENCDDGNATVGDGCDAHCRLESCGDDLINNVDETCDDGNDDSGDGCDSKCHLESCGDELLNNMDETCDDGNTGAGDGCDNACHLERCGDGAINYVTESCDDGNTVAGDGCSSVCASESCGDRVVNNGSETCDDGNSVAGDGCNSTCTREICGDSAINNRNETCDDGNSVAGDGCDTRCHIEFCGDQFVNNVTETCEDGNLVSGDGCSADCQTEVQPCGAGGPCPTAGCSDPNLLLSATCRWIVVGGGGGTAAPVAIRSDSGSIVGASVCGDVAESAGSTGGHLVTTAGTGVGTSFDAGAEVGEDIATGGASVAAGVDAMVPGTLVATVAGGSMLSKAPVGSVVDATGNSALVEACARDQAELVTAAAVLDAMPADRDLGSFKVPADQAREIDVTGRGLEVIDMADLRMGRRSTLTLKGGADDVVVIRVQPEGRLSLTLRARLVLDGLSEEHVLIYSQSANSCKIGRRVRGAGTVLCPDAETLSLGLGSTWRGSLLGARSGVVVRSRANLTSAAFTGF